MSRSDNPFGNHHRNSGSHMEGVRVAPEDYQPPFPLTAKLNKLTIRVDRPELSPEDINKLEEAQRNNKMRE